MNNNCPLLRIENLRTWIDTGETVVRAVDGVSLAVERGETFALLGESGCGKSVTALSVMRLLPDAGQIVGGTVELDGENLLALPEIAMRDVRGARIAMIFQEPMLSLNPVMTAGEQIAETLRRHTDLEGADIERRVLELLDAVRIPDAARRRHEYPFQFSGGMKQRVMIAMALACDPELLIADEPTTALDVTIQAQVLDLLRELQQSRRMSLLLITHDLAVVTGMAHRVAVMYAGQIVESASRADFFAHPAHPYSRKLFDSLPDRRKRDGTLAVIRGTVPPLTGEFAGCRFAERCDSAWDLCRRVVPGWHDAGGGQMARCHLFGDEGGGMRDAAEKRGQTPFSVFPSEPNLRAQSQKMGSDPFFPQQSLLEVKDLKVHFPIHGGLFKRVVARVMAVDGVTLAIPAGGTLGLVGESGCGKTTVGRTLLRLEEPSAGEIRYAGADLAGASGDALKSLRRRIQVIFQDPYSSLNPRMTIGQILAEPMRVHALQPTKAAARKRAEELLEQVGLFAYMANRYPHELSGGQRQRVGIARALALEPEFIVCDEPVSALDVSIQAQIINLLEELQQRLGLTYLFIAHDLAVVRHISDRVVVMYLGKVMEIADRDALYSAPQHPYTQALLDAVPVPDPRLERERGHVPLGGEIPSPLHPPSGCVFHTRCPLAEERCRREVPALREVLPRHWAACVKL